MYDEEDERLWKEYCDLEQDEYDEWWNLERDELRAEARYGLG